MGDNTGQAGDGQTGPKRHFKHIGELADQSKAKVVIMYRTVPGEPNNCLVVGTKFLPDLYHNALMRAVESEGGQEADEFADYAGRQAFPDGTNSWLCYTTTTTLRNLRPMKLWLPTVTQMTVEFFLAS